VFDGGNHAQRDADENGDGQRRQTELDRCREAFGQDDRHRPAEANRLAEVAPHHVAQVDPELDIDRLIQPVGFVESLAGLGGGFLPEDGFAGLTGDETRQQEDHYQDPHQHRD